MSPQRRVAEVFCIDQRYFIHFTYFISTGKRRKAAAVGGVSWLASSHGRCLEIMHAPPRYIDISLMDEMYVYGLSDVSFARVPVALAVSPSVDVCLFMTSLCTGISTFSISSRCMDPKVGFLWQADHVRSWALPNCRLGCCTGAHHT